MDPELHWYFSFGANMSQQVLQQSGIATAARSVPGFLPTWQLCFNYIGYDGVEPRFANIVPCNDEKTAMPVHGVAHQLSSADLAILDDIEDEGVSYKRVKVPFKAYDGLELEVWAYAGVPEWLAPGVPSARYLHLLVQGATTHNLRQPYVDWLAAHSCLDFKEAALSPLPLTPQLAATGPKTADSSTVLGPLDFLHKPGATAAEECSRLRIAGEAFHVPLTILRQRSFLRTMVRDGGTVFALRTLGKAHMEADWPSFSSCEDDFQSGIWMDGMSELQMHYVICWRRYLESHFSRA